MRVDSMRVSVHEGSLHEGFLEGFKPSGLIP